MIPKLVTALAVAFIENHALQSNAQPSLRLVWNIGMTRIQPARTNQLLEKLPRDELQHFRSHATEVDLVANDVLLEAGTALDYVYFPYDGLISLLVVMADGAIAEAGFVGSEGALGTSYDPATRISFTRATVIANGKALRLPLDEFEWLLKESSAFRDLINQNNNRIAERGQQIAACNLLHQLEPRLCRWLLQVFDNSQNSSAVITQDHLANMLGVNRARLNEALKILQNMGAIAQPGKQVLTIIDADVVAEKVCDCHGKMRVPKPD